jgi:hypothetical protein
MKQLSKLQSVLLLIGGILMVAGTGLFAFLICWHISCWLFLAGTVFFVLMQLMQVYEGRSLVVRRLKRIQGAADLFFVVSGISMVDTAYGFLMRMFTNYEIYLTYFYNKWVVFLLIAAVLEVYTTHRISYELKKENPDVEG